MTEQDPEKLAKRIKTAINKTAMRSGRQPKANTRITPNMLTGSEPKEPSEKEKKSKKSKRKASRKARRRNR